MMGRSETIGAHGAPFEAVSKANGLYRAYGDCSTDLQRVSDPAVERARQTD